MTTYAHRFNSSLLAYVVVPALVFGGCSLSRSDSDWGPSEEGPRASLYLLTAEQIEDASVSSIEALLEMYFSGFYQRTPDERPGAIGDVFLLGGNSPLFVIDGVPVEYEGYLGLNPRDVHSIELVKHGASAIYGMRGAAGAVLITTKHN